MEAADKKNKRALERYRRLGRGTNNQPAAINHKAEADRKKHDPPCRVIFRTKMWQNIVRKIAIIKIPPCATQSERGCNDPRNQEGCEQKGPRATDQMRP